MKEPNETKISDAEKTADFSALAESVTASECSLHRLVRRIGEELCKGFIAAGIPCGTKPCKHKPGFYLYMNEVGVGVYLTDDQTDFHTSCFIGKTIEGEWLSLYNKRIAESGNTGDVVV